ncbi:hypothetical protein SAMN05192561_10873 [Halopenitus malekzadehii]|uniref:Transcriptional regulator n=1 Tax=Halopenitus malekzadehii TaxID=1267564 RepID=A0A1H6JEZ7_9EURY|nr:DUF5821 family protein [Halopenitus malekzadehii]SEH57457.1 hypothetical protein SAMN05192561_10873 [Halopenitus malekzadehii]
MVSTTVDADVETVLESATADSDDDLLVVNPSTEAIEAIVSAGIDPDTPAIPHVRLLVEEATIADAMDGFLRASKAAALIDRRTLTIRTPSTDLSTTLLVTSTDVSAIVESTGGVGVLSSSDPAFAGSVGDAYRDRFADATDYRLRTPALDRVRETMDEAIGEEPRADFEAILEAIEDTETGDRLDAVAVALLVAAKHGVLLYDLSKWGEDVGLASKATFSRTKTDLEDHGVIETEKVPIDVGRPRLRLQLGDDRLRGLSPVELASTTAELLE